jgi:hypothetical protein
MAVWPDRIRFPGGGEFLAQLFQFFVERRLIGQQNRKLFVTLTKTSSHLVELIRRLRRHGGGLGQQTRSKAQAGAGVRFLAVGCRQPIAEMEQLAGGGQCVGRRNFPGAVHRQITQFLDESGFGEQRLAYNLPETGCVNQGSQMVLIRQFVGCAMRAILDVWIISCCTLARWHALLLNKLIDLIIALYYSRRKCMGFYDEQLRE